MRHVEYDVCLGKVVHDITGDYVFEHFAGDGCE